MRWTEEQLDEYLMSKRLPTPPQSTETPDKGKESRLQAKIEQWCRDKAYPFFHDRSRKKNVAGWPDLTIVMPGSVVLFLELKSVKGVLRPEQAKIRQRMVFLKHNHHIVKSYRGFLKIVWDITHDFDNL